VAEFSELTATILEFRGALYFRTINARAEEFTTKPAFRDAWARGQRCLVVTDGFYEWKKLDPNGKLKQPYAIAMADDGQMVMAGL
jgi:putative SOS response-associated peptidase YedK